MNIDFSKYQRIFAFGCSFTQYGWPTWADLIALQNPLKKYYNYGMAGLGNLGIAARIIECDKRYNFCDTDLVMVMWSTFCREDRYVKNGWLTFGNVFNSDYGKDWLEKFADPIGYLIRDHAIINLTNNFLQSGKFDSLILKSTPFLYTEKPIFEKPELETLKILYSKEYNDLPIDLYNFMGQDWTKCKQVFWDDSVDKPFMRHDFHPYTGLYADYLTKIGLELDDNVKDFAKKTDKLLISCKTKSEITKNFSYLSEMQAKDRTGLF